MITRNQLLLICQKAYCVERIYDALQECLLKYHIDTHLRLCHFLAQVLHESGNFLYFEEIASGQAYEGRKDLGNTQPGDGIKFKGRGLIQITGRANYESISHDFEIDFVATPTLLASDKYAVLSAGWFWNKHDLNAWADNDDLPGITKRINGGINGLEDRANWLNKCKLVLIANTQ